MRPYTNVTFTTAFTGSPPWLVQWYSNGVAIPGANLGSYLITNVLPTANGSYFSVSVSNLVYGVMSTNALLTVTSVTNKPTVASVVALANPYYQILVKFSEPVDPTTSQNSANYNITNGVGNVINVYSATLGADNETVTPYTDTLTDGQTYYLNPNNIQDLDLNTIAPGTVVPFTYSTLVGFWQFEEGSGTNTADSSPDGATGTLVNGPTWVSSPFGRWCLSYNGVNQYVDVDNPVPLQLQGAMTLWAWVWPAAATYSGGRVVAKEDGPGQRGWSLSAESPNTFHFSLAVDLNVTADLLVPSPVTNDWVHLACVCDPTVPSMTMYTNGLLAGTMADGVPPSQVDSGLDVEIGCRPPGANTPWTGLIDDVRIYARALAQSEIQALPELVQTP